MFYYIKNKYQIDYSIAVIKFIITLVSFEKLPDKFKTKFTYIHY